MLQPPTKFEVRGRHTFGFSINQPDDIDLEPGARYLLLMLVFLGLFVLDLWANTCQTDHVTLRP